MDTRQIVVAYDFSPEADVALERAIEIACRAPDHVLHFLTAIDPHRGVGLEANEVVTYEYAEQIAKTLGDRLAEIFAVRSPDRPIQYFVHSRIGDPVEEILDLAADFGADLIVVGSHGRTGIKRLLLGSVSEAVVRRAGCPVIVARKKRYKDVPLEKVIEVEAHPRHVRSHQYSYAGHPTMTRPSTSPLY